LKYRILDEDGLTNVKSSRLHPTSKEAEIFRVMLIRERARPTRLALTMVP